MSRKMIDCRKVPSEIGCTLTSLAARTRSWTPLRRMPSPGTATTTPLSCGRRSGPGWKTPNPRWHDRRQLVRAGHRGRRPVQRGLERPRPGRGPGLASEDCVFEPAFPAADGERSTGRAAIRAAREPVFDNQHSHFAVADSWPASASCNAGGPTGRRSRARRRVITVRNGQTFEGVTSIGLGIHARLPLRVMTLSRPGRQSRLVIDVARHW